MRLDLFSPKSTIRARMRVPGALLLLACAACGSSSSDVAGAADAGDAAPTTDAGVDGPPPVTPEAGTPDAPPPPPPPVVRDCGVHATAAKPLRVAVLVPKLNPVSLGEGLDLSKLPPTTSITYVTGNVATDDADTEVGSAGDDVAADQMFPIGSGAFNLFQEGGGAGNPVAALARTIAADGGPNPTATTFSVAASRLGETWTLTAPARTADAPSSPEITDAYVGTLSSSTFFGYAFGIRFDSPCGMDALADALGVKAKAANVLAAASSPLVRKALVDNGAQLTIIVVANKPHPAVDALLATGDAGTATATTCAADDLPACKRLMDALSAEEHAWAMANPSTDLAAVTGGTDPTWSFVAYDAKTPLPSH